MGSYTTIEKCRLCGSGELVPLFSLGDQFVSSFVSKEDVLAGPKVPIDICLCPSCTLVQQKHTAPQELLYSRHYWYKSSQNATMREALADVAQSLARAANLQPGDVALDIGSNDGHLLRCYPDWLCRWGVEPADNLIEESQRGTDGAIHGFWGTDDCFRRLDYCLSGKKAKAVTAIGCFYDLDDPNPFICDVARVLHPEGVFVAQLMCLKQTLDKLDVGNFCHEHLEFYSYESIRHLFEQHGLTIFDVEENAVNGGSYRFYVKHACKYRANSVNTVRIDHTEQEMRLGDPATYASWFSRIQANRDKCVAFIREAVAAGKKVWVYGSSTKGNVILQYYGLDHSLITAAADRDPAKWGKFTIGTGIPIVSEDEFRRAKPDIALVLPWAFKEEFLARERAWMEGGGKFLFPLPEPHVVEVSAKDMAERAYWLPPNRMPMLHTEAL